MGVEAVLRRRRAERRALLERARLDALGDRPPLVQPIAWTSDEYRRELGRGNPMALEAVAKGVWLVGSAQKLKSDR